jgi:polyphosphate glucokinase
MKEKKRRNPRRVLVIDVGGSHVKFRVGERGAVQKFPSGPDMSAAQMVQQVRERTQDMPYDAVSIGYPGVVIRNRIVAEPHNLGQGWLGFDFQRALGKPVRLINDAAMQAIGSYRGARMLFLGLGTGLGATLVFDNVVEPMELGHLPYESGRTYEEVTGERGRKRMGTRKWRRVVKKVVDRLRQALEVDYVVLGGGNAKRLKKLPEHARLGDNQNAFRGGLRIWRGGSNPLVLR